MTRQSNAILERMPVGFAGDVTRKAEATLEPGMVGAAAIPFGAPAVYAEGKLRPVAAGDTAIAGFIARPYPTQTGEALPGTVADVLKRGYMAVRVAAGTAAHGGQVHVRLVAAAGKAAGDIETAADGDNTLAVPGCVFQGPVDAEGVTEISFNL